LPYKYVIRALNQLDLECMAKVLKSSSSSHSQGNHADWQMLGELTLTNESAGDEQIRSWLTGLLLPLALQAEFLNRIVVFARDAARRALQPELKLEHIHLKIFCPRDLASTGQTWGFFQVQKLEDVSSHAVEFFLYTEGSETTN